MCSDGGGGGKCLVVVVKAVMVTAVIGVIVLSFRMDQLVFPGRNMPCKYLLKVTYSK